MAISMKTSPKWLQSFFDQPLPEEAALADALTFHSCEIEEITPSYIDVNVLPDRAAYCLSHRGIAYELSAILKMEMHDPLRIPLVEFPSTNELTVTIDDESKCMRYMGAIVRGVKVGPSPDWLREALESVGQRSINNIVDATNYVMLDIGQPLHAFDAARLTARDGAYSIHVRGAQLDEKITTLTGQEYTLPEGTLLITDGNSSGAPIGIAGVKGGKAAEITDTTADIIIESASFDGSLVRKTSQKLKLWTDASQRYQNKPSPELAAYGMRAVLKLIADIAGGEVVGVVDAYSDEARAKAAPLPVSVTLTKINSTLGTSYTLAHVSNVFQSLGFAYLNEGDLFTVTPPFERRDILIAEDLIEEVGRILGYDQIEATSLPALDVPADQSRYHALEHLKDFLIERGFTELSTQSFAAEGQILLANPLDQTRPALRDTLVQAMRDALGRAALTAPRVLGPAKELRLFEIGTVFTKTDEHYSLSLGVQQLGGKENPSILDEARAQLQEFIPSLTSDIIERVSASIAEIHLDTLDLAPLSQEDGHDYTPKRIHLGAYKQFSLYPFALRDIAVWTPGGTEADEVVAAIMKEASDLLVRIDLFDRFEKKSTEGVADKISYAYRLVFESSERTLSDEDLNPLMEKITVALNAREGWEVR